jgi:hypothetical protein
MVLPGYYTHARGPRAKLEGYSVGYDLPRGSWGQIILQGTRCSALQGVQGGTHGVLRVALGRVLKGYGRALLRHSRSSLGVLEAFVRI